MPHALRRRRARSRTTPGAPCRRSPRSEYSASRTRRDAGPPSSSTTAIWRWVARPPNALPSTNSCISGMSSVMNRIIGVRTNLRSSRSTIGEDALAVHRPLPASGCDGRAEQRAAPPPSRVTRVVREHVVQRRRRHRQRLERHAARLRVRHERRRRAPGVHGDESPGVAAERVRRRDAVQREQLLLPLRGGRVHARLDRRRAGHGVLERARRVERDEPPLVDDGDAVAQPVRFIHVMRRDQHGEPAHLARAS